MMEVGSLLPTALKEDADARRYLTALLAKSLPKLEKEKAVLTAEEVAADKQLDAQAIQQSKVCFHSSQSLTQIKSQCSSFLSLTSSALSILDSSITSLKASTDSQVLWHLQHLKAVKNQQAVLSEILEIPNMLHTLHAAGMFEEMLSLLKYVKGLTKNTGSPLIDKLTKDAYEYQKLLETSIQNELASSLDAPRTHKALKYPLFRLIEELIGVADSHLCHLFLSQRLLYFSQKTDTKLPPSPYLCNYSSTLQDLVLALKRDEVRFPPTCKRYFDLFLFDRIVNLLDVCKDKLVGVEKLSELKTVYNALNKLNEEALDPAGVGVGRELAEMILKASCEKIREFAEKIQSSFESMLRLYQWDNSTQRDNPLLKFGGIAVLYNNSLYLINEVRQFRLSETEAVFCSSMGTLFLNVANFTLQRGQHLRGAGPRTPQQNVYRGLFFEFVEVMRKYALPPLMSSIRETFPSAQIKPRFVPPT